MKTPNPDRFFSPDAARRNIAGELYQTVASLPLVCPHGHVDLFIIPDHYITCMLYSQGMDMQRLGLIELENSGVPDDPVSSHRTIWCTFCENFHLFRGTPSGIWLIDELRSVFGMDEKPGASNADRLFDSVLESQQVPER